MLSKSIRRYQSFCKSLQNLARSQNACIDEAFVLEGTIQNFNLTFDLSWKVLKDVLLEHKGVLEFATGSPRDTLQTAYSNGLIRDDNWLKMLRLRNQLAHDYDMLLARDSFDTINEVYYKLFVELKEILSVYFREDFRAVDSFK